MNQARIVPAAPRSLPDWSRLETKTQHELDQLKTVPDFDQMLQDHAASRKKIPLRAVYVYLPEHATQFRSSVQAGLQQLQPAPVFEPPGRRPPDGGVTQSPNVNMPGAGGAGRPSPGNAPTSKGPAPPTTQGPMDTTNSEDDKRQERDSTATSSNTDPIQHLLLQQRMALIADDNTRMRARQQELQDEMIKVRLQGEQQARRTAFIDQNVDRLRALPQAVPMPPVSVVHNHTNVSNTLVQPISTFVNNIQTNFHHVHNNVNVVHNQALNFIQNHANRAINMAVNVGGSLADAFESLPAPRPAQAAILDAITSGSGGGPPPPPPAAGAVRIARSIKGGRQRPTPYGPLINTGPPQPLAPAPSSAIALPVQPLTIEERDSPYVVPVQPKKKPRMMAIEDAYRPKSQPPLPGPYIPPSMPKMPARLELEDAPVRRKADPRTPRTRKRTLEDAEEPPASGTARPIARGRRRKPTVRVVPP